MVLGHPSIPITFRMGRTRVQVDQSAHSRWAPYLVGGKKSNFATCHIKGYLRLLQGNDLVSFGSLGGPGLPNSSVLLVIISLGSPKPPGLGALLLLGVL